MRSYLGISPKVNYWPKKININTDTSSNPRVNRTYENCVPESMRHLCRITNYLARMEVFDVARRNSPLQRNSHSLSCVLTQASSVARCGSLSIIGVCLVRDPFQFNSKIVALQLASTTSRASFVHRGQRKACNHRFDI